MCTDTKFSDSNDRSLALKMLVGDKSGKGRLTDLSSGPTPVFRFRVINHFACRLFICFQTRITGIRIDSLQALILDLFFF